MPPPPPGPVRARLHQASVTRLRLRLRYRSEFLHLHWGVVFACDCTDSLCLHVLNKGSFSSTRSCFDYLLQIGVTMSTSLRHKLFYVQYFA